MTAFDAAERIADAVLYEGYVLYPYRATSVKNRLRWQFGVLAPQAPHETAEPCFSQTECLLRASEAGAAGRVRVRLRCLRPQGEAGQWLEGVPLAIDFDPIPLDELPLSGEIPIDVGAVAAALTFGAEICDGFVRIRLRVENREPWSAAFDASRDAMLCRSLVGAHLLLAVDGAEWISLLEPPPEAAAVARRCTNIHTWPVLVGERPSPTLMLSSPIILYDYPSVATQSQGDLCDAAEIDEILSLRILTMTDDEKAEARRTDPKARAILERVEAMTPEDLGDLHGEMRTTNFFNPPEPAPDEASVVVDGVRVAKRSHVRLRPNRRADAMDMFFRDQRATVAGVYRDVDGRVHVAVTVDADPAAAMHESFGRYFYFSPDEVEPLDAAGAAEAADEEHV